MSSTDRISAICFLVALLVGCTSLSNRIQDVPTQPSLHPTTTLEHILSTGVLTVGTTGDYTPYSYHRRGQEDTFYGIDITLAHDLAKSLGVKVEFVKTSWPTLMDDLATHKFDIGMCGITITLDRQKHALFSLPFSSGGKAAIARDEDADKFKTIATINQKEVRVIVNPGGTNEQFAKQHFPEATLILNDDNISIFQKIVDQEADVMVTDAIETIVQSLVHPELEAVNPNEPFNFFEKAYLLPVDHTFKAYVDQWVNLRRKDGTYERIFEEEMQKIKDSKE